MSMPEAVFHQPRSLPLQRRVPTYLAVGDAVTAVSLTCAAREGCVARSLATILLCRLRGRWASWCVGARRVPPFGAHAWVEVGGIPVGEDEYPPDYFRKFFTVP